MKSRTEFAQPKVLRSVNKQKHDQIFTTKAKKKTKNIYIYIYCIKYKPFVIHPPSTKKYTYV